MEKANQLKIAIVGPESTGKSEMSKALSELFGVYFTKEYAREYLIDSIEYNQSDVLKIAKEQFRLIQSNHEPIVIADTELIVTKIWQKFKYNNVDQWIENHILKQEFDLYLLMNIDLEWKNDPLRENPSKKEREELLKMYQNQLTQYKFNFHLVSGKGQKRLQNALNAIKNTAKSLQFPLNI